MRTPAFDVLKFILMVMVIRGHLEGCGFFIPIDGFVYNLSIGISMPLFFMISGYFATKTFEANDGTKIICRIISFLWPLAAFGLVFGLVLFAWGKCPFWKFMLYPAVRVLCGSWFLRTLAMIYALVAITWKLIKPMKLRLVVLLVMYVLLFFIAGQDGIFAWLNLSNVLHMFPYFVFGVLALKPLELYKKSLVAIPCGIFLLTVVFLEGDVRTNGMAFYWVSSDWHVVVADKHLFVCFWLRSAVGIAGSIFVLWGINKLVETIPFLTRFAPLGTTTLGVYVMHEWPLVQIHKYFLFDPMSSYWRWPLAIILFFICHYITIFINSNHKFHFFFFGDQKWLRTHISEIINIQD